MVENSRRWRWLAVAVNVAMNHLFKRNLRSWFEPYLIQTRLGTIGNQDKKEIVWNCWGSILKGLLGPIKRIGVFQSFQSTNFTVGPKELVSVMRGINKVWRSKDIQSDPNKRNPNLWEYHENHGHQRRLQISMTRCWSVTPKRTLKWFSH